MFVLYCNVRIFLASKDTTYKLSMNKTILSQKSLYKVKIHKILKY